MITDFIQYGALGILGFTIWFDKTKTNKLIEKISTRNDIIINNNTIAMTKFYEIAKKCKR